MAFRRNTAFLALACAAWGVSCADVFHPYQSTSVLRGWAVVIAAFGIAALSVYLVRYRSERSAKRGLAVSVASIGAFLAGGFARPWVASAIWDVRCSSKTDIRHCYQAAMEIGAFQNSGNDWLGRQCIGSEIPYTVCRFSPIRDERSCGAVASECAAWATRMIPRPFAAAICEEWQDSCRDLRAAGWPVARQPGPVNPRSWPPPFLSPADPKIPGWLRTKADSSIDENGR